MRIVRIPPQKILHPNDRHILWLNEEELNFVVGELFTNDTILSEQILHKLGRCSQKERCEERSK